MQKYASGELKPENDFYADNVKFWNMVLDKTKEWIATGECDEDVSYLKS